MALLPEMERSRWFRCLSEAEVAALEHNWKFWGRKSQIAPDGIWSTWLILAGRGFGKTRSGAEWVRDLMCGSTPLARGKCRHIALVGETAADVRKVMVGDGLDPGGEASGILQVHPKDFRPIYNPSLKRVRWPNGAIATLYNATEPDELRGPQHEAGWCFVAGTMVATPDGEREIEGLRPGDLVMTRRGARPIIAVSARAASVGRVTFSNGKELIGTADHPVYILHGWTGLQSLKTGDRACVIAASNGAAGYGTCVNAAITKPARLAFIENFGFRHTVPSLMDLRFITRTRTSSITHWIIWNAFRSLTIRRNTSISRILAAIGFRGPQLPLGVKGAEQRFTASEGTIDLRPASDVSERWPTKNDQPQRQNAGSAVNCSDQGPATIAVSVASTWRRMAVSVVHCLKVGGESEYFANGILVHNCDELAKWQYAQETWDQLQLGLRLGTDPRVVITTTPKPIKLLKDIINDSATVVTSGATFENEANLSPRFLQTVVRRYEGTRLGRQELNAELLEDIPGALWQRSKIDALRVKPSEVPQLVRVVVAIDPAVTSGEDSDETGIIVAGLGANRHGYVFEDRSGRYKPTEWATEAIAAYRNPLRPADRVIGEINNGGEMIESTLRVVDANVPYKSVHASRGKVKRAEPASALYEKNLVHHVGSFPVLEDQMCGFTSDFDKKIAGYSPDRLDALVWALTELMVDQAEGMGVFEYYRLAAEKLRAERGEIAAAKLVTPTTGVRLHIPNGVSNISAQSGRSYLVEAGGLVTVHADDVQGLLSFGAERV